MASMNVRSGDTVEIIVGGVENRGKRGKITACNPTEGTVIVEGLNLVTKHKKPRSAQEQGGKVERPRAIDVSNVIGDHGKYLRACKKCGAVIDVKEERKATKTTAKTTAKKATTAKKTTTRKKTTKTEE